MQALSRAPALLFIMVIINPFIKLLLFLHYYYYHYNNVSTL